MDTLTHGLLGVAVAAAIRRPESGPGKILTPTDRACLLAALAAAELPDLDYLLPAANDALHALRAHRGWSHALVFAPVIAAVATLVARLVFRAARTLPVYLTSLAAVVLAHLSCDAWTGWGTRLFLPFSDARLSLDWTMVLDPWFTLPLLAGAIVAVIRRRHRWRRALVVGLAVSLAYLGFRITSREVLAARVRAAYPAATRVDVFPTFLSVHRWRYVAVLQDDFVAGAVTLAGPAREQARHPRVTPDLPANATIKEALAWARFPVVTTTAEGDIRIADLRYHLGGAPTLAFVIRLAPDGRVTSARLDRGRAADLVKRWRQDD